MGKSLLAIGVSALTMISCSTSSGPTFSKCSAIGYMKAGIDEKALLADLRQLMDTPGVASVADYTGDGSSYLTVYITPGHDLDVREKVSSLGWQRVDVIPSSAKPGSRALGTRWSS